MKRILMVLARLYPKQWRARYGVEYEALLEERQPQVRDVFDVIRGGFKMHMTKWNPARILLVCSVIGALVAVAISFTRQKMYLSQTLISVDTVDRHSMDNELARNRDDVLAQPFLAAIIQQENLYPGERARMPENELVDLMRRDIRIRPLQTRWSRPGSGFLLQFAYPDPHVAQRVDEELASRLVASNLQRRIQDPSGSPGAPLTFRVDGAANLPNRPFSPRLQVFGADGLLVGLAGGLILAAIAAWRGRLTVSGV